MSDQLQTIGGGNIAAIDPDLIRENRLASKADETKRALIKNWTRFESWCDAQGQLSLPASLEAVEAFLLYLSDHHPRLDPKGRKIRSGLKTASVNQALWAINSRHRMAGHPPPGDTEPIKMAIAGIRRRKGSRSKQQAPLTIDHIRSISFREDLKGLRDKALLLTGFAGCFRRSELVSLKVEDIHEDEMGLRVYLEKSKTDQEGAGNWVDIVKAVHFPEFCPVEAIKSWLAASGIQNGHIFRPLTKGNRLAAGEKLSSVSVDAIVKWAAGQCGFNPQGFGGHSLRAGKATYLSENGKSLTLIAKHGRWKSLDMVLTYCRGETARDLYGVY